MRFSPLGNKPKTQIAIALFIVLLLAWLARCAHAQGRAIDFGAGASLTHGPGAPVVELDYLFPLGFSRHQDILGNFGTTLMAPQNGNPNNWAWYGGIEGQRWNLHVGLGMAYLARTDTINGQHAEFTLTMGYVFPHCGWFRTCELRYRHFSDAGTSRVNQGRDFVLFMLQLR